MRVFSSRFVVGFNIPIDFFAVLVDKCVGDFYKETIPIPAHDGATGDSNGESVDTYDGGGKKRDWKWAVEHRLYPAFKAMFHPPSRLEREISIVEVADLHQLYKVFERC